MRRRRLVIVWVACVLVVLPAAIAGASGMRTAVRVSPRVGGIHTTFKLRFSIPYATGATGTIDRSDWVLINGRGHAGCVGGAEVPLPAAAAHHRFNVTLNPAHLDGHWCTGTFSGTLVGREATICGPVTMRALLICPQYVVAPQVLARFRFTVHAPA